MDDQMKTPFWREYGFQSDNPRTDFRAAGLLGLRQLVYFAEKYHSEFLDIAERTKHHTFYLVLTSIEISVGSFNIAFSNSLLALIRERKSEFK
jgi:hypothetical protein